MKLVVDLASLQFSHVLGTHLSFADSIPQCGSLAPEVPVGLVGSEGVEVYDPRGVFHLCPCEIGYGIYSKFANHNLTSENFQNRLKVRRRTTQTRSVPS